MSSTRQILEDVIDRLRELAWSAGSAEDVFGAAVFSSTQEVEEHLSRLSRGFALVQVDGEDQDPNEPSIYRVTLSIEVYLWHGQGYSGESAIIGANRGDLGSTEGAGLLHLDAAIKGALNRVSDDQGARGGYRLRIGEPVQTLSDLVSGAFRRYLLEAVATADDTWPDPVFIHGVDQTGGDILLNFERPGARSDYSALVLRRASGSTPPASATAGTGVTITDESTGSHTDSPGAGTWSYALFSAYVRQGVTSYSSAVTWTGAVT